jgi:hypothetical protein
MPYGTELNNKMVADELKKKLIDYLIKNHNITWINDDIEKEMYNLLFLWLDEYIICKYWNDDIQDQSKN